MFRDGYKSIFIGTGVWKPNSLHIKGETFGNVHFGINYLNNPDSYHLGETVIVIGAGNAAMDVARTAKRKGSRNVICLSLRKLLQVNMNSAMHSLKESHLNITNALLRLKMTVLYSGILLRMRMELSLM